MATQRRVPDRPAPGQQRHLAPFGERIETDVQRFPDPKLYYRGPGSVYQSRRFRIRTYVEQCVLAPGAAPTGRHCVRVSGYTCGDYESGAFDCTSDEQAR